ncbi:MAG: hypothetical protein J4432_05140 [DPANN group archaeon]|nr:hypothetical protein [DPANN group archaeon]
MNTIVCDASSLISLSDNCLFKVLLGLSKNVEFIIPPGVLGEIIENPMHSKRFELKAIMMKDYLTSGAIKVSNNKGIQDKTERIINVSNQLLMHKKRPIKIIHQGEAEAIACLQDRDLRYLLIDERTTRLLIEDTDQLKDYIENRTGLKLTVNEKSRRELEPYITGINVVRSAELLAYAHEQGLLEEYGKHGFEAALWALKFSGCSITNSEIDEYLRMF